MKRSGPWLASLSLLAAACAGVPAALSQPAPSSAPATVVVHTDQPQGRFLASSVSNASVEALYGQVTSDLSEPFFQWVRVSNGLSHVRCYNWLGDGIPKGHPEWFSGCRVARRGPAGEPVYQWEGLERVLDTLVASGVTPVIVCGGIPDALAAGPVRRNEGGQAVNRPKDYAQYQELIAQMLRRLEKTYGAEEVRSWYFEVWSQPDHEGSWEGGRPAPFTGDLSPADVAPFSKLYDHFVAGAVSVDPKVRVGGPGLAGDAAFLRRFLEHCARETNAATGQKGTRLDFLSWHHYGGVADTVRYNEDLRRMVDTDFP
ncbi:MAG TPA: hypothetical protein VFU47_07185, partial [Armatimonadota bacterium]|nr:hypothetical protein [Armatimonadota bacterium]